MSDYKDGGLSGYTEVAERIRMFREMYPEGSLQPANPERPFEVIEVPEAAAMQWLQAEESKIRAKGGQYVEGNLAKLRQPLAFVVYTAAAYRQADDRKPGIGVAWEPFPGETNFTHNSEVMNAETSAWGRAIIAVGAADAKASANEIRNRRAEQDDGIPVPVAKLELVKALQGDKTLASKIWKETLLLPDGKGARVSTEQLAEAVRVGVAMSSEVEPFGLADEVEAAADAVEAAEVEA